MSQITPSQITISQIARINSQRQIVIGQVATTQIATILKSQNYSTRSVLSTHKQLDHLAVSYQQAVRFGSVDASCYGEIMV